MKVGIILIELLFKFKILREEKDLVINKINEYWSWLGIASRTLKDKFKSITLDGVAMVSGKVDNALELKSTDFSSWSGLVSSSVLYLNEDNNT